MRLNSHKNVGEIYEVLENFKLSKTHYTQALKIKKDDSWVWNKIGGIEYEKFGNLQIAKQCFEAAINTRPTLQKRSAAICPVLVKLSEINFKLQDFKKSEELVDAIISRQNAPNIDINAKLFALKLKAFFHSLKGEEEQKFEIFEKLEKITGQKECSYHDLQLIKDFYQGVETAFQRHSNKGIPIYDKEQKKFSFIKVQGLQLTDKKFNWFRLKYQQSGSLSIQNLFDQLLEKFAQNLDDFKISQLETKVECSNFIENCQNLVDEYKDKDYNETIKKQEKPESQEHFQDKLSKGTKSKKLNSNTSAPNDIKNTSAQNATGTRRGLRRKMDFTEQQLSQINLESLDSYKDYICNEFQSQLQKREDNNSQVLEFVYSQRELMKCKKLIENKELFKNSQNQINSARNSKIKNQLSQKEEALTNDDLNMLLKLFKSLNRKVIQNAIRTILLYSFDHNLKLINEQNSMNLYKLFQHLMIIEGPFSEGWLSKSKENWEYYCGQGRNNDMIAFAGNSINILVSVFELSLFNKQVPKCLKSGQLIEQRQVLFDFFNINQSYINSLIGSDQNLQIRLFYALMYCAFEIRNDMMQSVNMYTQLQNYLQFINQDQVSISQPWLSQDYVLDNQRMAEFGDFKIKQAKIFKDFDSGLLKLKQREHESFKQKQESCIDEHEFDKYANFYLDQFFLYLNTSVTINKQDGEKQSSSCSQIQNEEKVKEMWNQLIYSLCRAKSSLLFKATQNLFCVFTTISYLNKSFYEQFILKKLDFEKLLSAIHKKLQIVYNEIVANLKENTNVYQSIYQVRDFTLEKLNQAFGIEQSSDHSYTEAVIQRFLISILRQITPEFLHYNVFLTQSSNNVFQNMMQVGLQNGVHPSMVTDSRGISQSNQNMSIISTLCHYNHQEGLIQIFPQIFYYFEFFKSIINSDPQKDNSFNLRSITRLLMHIDKLSYQNVEKKDIFCRSYAQLVVHAFPVLIRCLKIDIARQKMQTVQENNGLASIQISSTKNLLLYVSQMFKFFFDMKISLKELEDDDEEMIDEEEECQDEDDETFRRQAHLSCLLSQLKREKQSKYWAQSVNGNKTPILKFFLNNCQLDIDLFSDIISVISFLTQDRVFKHNELTLKDIKTIQAFNDVLLEFFMSNIPKIQEQLASEQGNNLVRKFKEISKNCPVEIQLQLQEFQMISLNQRQKTQHEELNFVLEYILNMLSHTILSQCPFQIPRFDMAFKLGHHQQLSQTLNNQAPNALNNSGGIINNFYFAYTKKGGALGNFPVQIAKIHETILSQISETSAEAQVDPTLSTYQQFKNLNSSSIRNLSKIVKFSLLQFPLLFSQADQISRNFILNEKIVSVSFMQSFIYHQLYLINCDNSFFSQNKKQQKDSVGNLKQRYFQNSLNNCILALVHAIEMHNIRDQNQYLNIEATVWNSYSFFDLTKMILDQLLAIVISKIKFIKIKNKLKRLQNQSTQKQIHAKVQNLKVVAYLIASICDITDVFSAPVNDPRLKNQPLKQKVLVILQEFLKCFKDNNDTQSIVHKTLISVERAEQCLQIITNIGESQNFQSRADTQRIKLNFLYSFIKAKYSSALNPRFGIQNLTILMNYRRAIEIAQVNKNINGVLESFRKFIQNSLKLATKQKYYGAQMTDRDRLMNQNIIQQVIKPILQDQELKKYMFKDLGQSLLNGLKDSDIQDEQVQQLSYFMKQGNDSNQNNELCQIEVIIQNFNSTFVRKQFVKQELNGDDLLSGNIQNIQEENDLNQIYKVADFIFNNLSNSTKQWLKAKYQLMCCKQLFEEVKIIEQSPPTEKIKLLVDMLKPINQQLLTYEDQWNGMIYDDRDSKNLITSLNHKELLGLTNLRLKFNSFFIQLAQQAFDYEPVKEIFKKKLQVTKQSDDSPQVLIEQRLLFDQSKDLYIQILCSFIENQLEEFRHVRKLVKSQQDLNDNKWKQQNAKQAKDTYERMRKEFNVTKDNVPSQLKEIFDIFVEIHSKKGFLVTRRLISEDQRRMIIQGILNCCAICGPDNFNADDKKKSKNFIKFLDISKLTEPEYQQQGLMICIQWYLEVLEKQGMKKNMDFHKKLKSTMDDIKSMQKN